MTAWYVYLLECVDGSVYTGIAVDVDRRYAQRVAGKRASHWIFRCAHPSGRPMDDLRFACHAIAGMTSVEA